LRGVAGIRHACEHSIDLVALGHGEEHHAHATSAGAFSAGFDCFANASLSSSRTMPFGVLAVA
jgi:hypothetical protein